MGILPLVIILM